MMISNIFKTNLNRKLYCRADIIDQLIGLKATQYLVNETEYIPWAAAVRHLKFIRTMLDRSDAYGDYQVHCIVNMSLTII